MEIHRFDVKAIVGDFIVQIGRESNRNGKKLIGFATKKI